MRKEETNVTIEASMLVVAEYIDRLTTIIIKKEKKSKEKKREHPSMLFINLGRPILLWSATTRSIP